jgi:predicted secreted protein
MHATIALVLALLAPLVTVPADTAGGVPAFHGGASAATSPGAGITTASVATNAWRYGVTRINIGCDAFVPAAGGTAGVDVARTVTMGDRGTLLVSVCSNPTTGYRWTWPTYTHALFRFVARSYTTPKTGLLGAAGKDLFRFRAIHAGTGRIRLTYSQPWAGGQKATRTVTLTVRAISADPSLASASTTVTCDQFAAAQDATGHAAVARTVTASSGGSITVILCSNPSTGFSWEQPAFDAAKLRLERHATSEPSGLIGAAGTETWTFRVLSPGDTQVSFAYSQPWAGGEKSVWTVVLTIRAG